MKFNDALIGLALIVLAGLIAWYVRDFPPMPGQRFGPSLFPQLIAAGFALTGVALIVSGIRQRGTEGWIELSDWMRETGLVRNFFVVIAAVSLHAGLSDWLGFLITAPLALTAVLVSIGNRWRVAVPTAIVVVLVIHWIFYGVLKVALPWGLLEPIAW